MVDDSTEKGPEERDCKPRTSPSKEIPRWGCTTSSSCERINELICCERTAHSVLFYVLVVLFLLIFVYIIRKLVSLPSSHPKLNGRRPSNNGAVALRNHSSSALVKKRPIEWPKIDIADHLGSPAWTKPKSSKHDRKDRIYGAYEEFKNKNALRNPGDRFVQKTNDVLPQGGDVTQQGSGMPSPKGPNDRYPAKLTSSVQTTQGSGTWTEPPITDIDHVSNFPDVSSSGMGNQLQPISSSPTVPPTFYTENSGFGKMYKNWPVSDGSISGYGSNSVSPKIPVGTWNHRTSYGESDFSGYSGNSQLAGRLNQFSLPSTNGRQSSNSEYNGLPWSSVGYGKSSGSGFGYVRSGDQEQKNTYQSSMPVKQDYIDEDTNKWTYSGNDGYTNPSSSFYNSDEQERNKYDNFNDRNGWDANYDYGKINQTADWSNHDAAWNHERVHFWAKDNIENNNDIYLDKETDETIHRWPLDEATEDHSVSHTSSSQNGQEQPYRHDVDKKETRHSLKKKNLSFLPKKVKRKHRRHKKTNMMKFTEKKSKIPVPYSSVPHKHRTSVKHRVTKVKVKLKRKGSRKGKASRQSTKVREIKHNKNKRRTKKSSKHKRHPFKNYASYMNFIRKHGTGEKSVGNWKRKTHHVKKCKPLSKFKTQGKVTTKSQYLRRKRTYKYTITLCKPYKRHRHKQETRICHEFWFITTGKILLRELTKNDKGITYLVMLCQRKPKYDEQTTHDNNRDSDIHVQQEENEDVDNDDNDDHNDNDIMKQAKQGARVDHAKNNDKSKDLDDDIDDGEIDLDDKNNDHDTGTDKHEKSSQNSHGRKKNHDGHNVRKHDKNKNDAASDLPDLDDYSDEDDQNNDDDNDDDIDDDNDDDNDDIDDDIDDDHDDDKDDNDDDDNDDDIDNNNSDDQYNDKDKHVDHHHNIHKKLLHKKHKINRQRTKPRIKARRKHMHIRKRLHKRKLKLKRKITNVSTKREHKTATSSVKESGDNNVYKQLLEKLLTTHKTKDTDRPLIDFVASLSHAKPTVHPAVLKKHKTKKLSKSSRTKNISHKKKNRKATTKKTKISRLKTSTDNKNEIAVQTLLENLVLKSNSVQSLLQDKRKTLPRTQKRKKKVKVHQNKPLPKTFETKKILAALLPRLGLTSTALSTPEPTKPTLAPPTPKPTKASTRAPDQNTQLLGLLKKFGVKINQNTNTSKSEDIIQPSKLVLKEKFPLRSPHTTQSTMATSLPRSPGQTTAPVSSQAVTGITTDEPSPNDSSPLSTANAKVTQSNFAPTQAPTTRQLQSPPLSISRQGTDSLAIPQPRPSNNGYYRNSNYFPRSNIPGSYRDSSVNILCFGDSLTSGYYNHGRGKHPYSIRLNQILNANGNHHFKVVTSGVVGEMVHGSMTKRLPKVMNGATHFDWAIILGGTNDVAHVKNFGDDEEFTEQLINVWSPKIVKDIESLHQTARNHGARTVLVTIPETAFELWPEFRSIRNMRLSVNAALRRYATQVKDTTVLCDLAILLPRSSVSKELQKRYWNDHIHLNPEGYNRMAELIAQCLQPYLTK